MLHTRKIRGFLDLFFGCQEGEVKVLCHQSAIYLNQTTRGKRYITFQNVFLLWNMYHNQRFLEKNSRPCLNWIAWTKKAHCPEECWADELVLLTADLHLPGWYFGFTNLSQECSVFQPPTISRCRQLRAAISSCLLHSLQTSLYQ